MKRLAFVLLLLPAHSWAQKPTVIISGDGSATVVSVGTQGPPGAPAEGYMAYTRPTLMPWDASAPILWDEFATGFTNQGTMGQLNWFSSCSGSGGFIWGVANHPGILRCTTGATSADAYLIQQAAGGPLVAEEFYYKAIMRISSAVNEAKKRVGWFYSAGDPPAHGAYFECLNTDTNWFSVTRETAVQTRKDTGVAFNGAAWPVFEIWHPSPTIWDFYLNGIKVTSHTTGENLPNETRSFVAG
jgi:hypothetical protein